jgi:hypothetical protein
LQFNATDTASNAASLLMDLQRGGNSQFIVRRNGYFGNQNSGFLDVGGRIDVTVGTNVAYSLTAGNFNLAQTNLSFTASFGGANSGDVVLGRRDVRNLRLGAVDAATALAQTFSVQSVVAGTTNGAGANFTITGSQGTGSGAGGSIIFQVAPAGGSGTGQNTLSTALTIDSTRLATFTGFVDSSGGGFRASFGSSGGCAAIFTGVRLGSDATIGWHSGAPSTGSPDLILVRDAPNTLALRNGANAQTFRVYGTYNGTNDEWIQLDHGVTSANTATILSTKTGSGVARAIEVQVGTARKIRFGTSGGWELFNGATREGYFNWDAFTVRSDAFVGFASSTTVPSGQGDTNLIRVGAAIMGIRGGNTTTGGALSFIEQTAPVAPAANGVYIYAEDNGSGKTRLMALFATGAAQQIAIEP